VIKNRGRWNVLTMRVLQDLSEVGEHGGLRRERDQRARHPRPEDVAQRRVKPAEKTRGSMIGAGSNLQRRHGVEWSPATHVPKMTPSAGLNLCT